LEVYSLRKCRHVIGVLFLRTPAIKLKVWYYYYYLLKLICHSVAVVLTLVQTKQMRINIHKRNKPKHSTNNTKHSKYKYTYY